LAAATASASRNRDNPPMPHIFVSRELPGPAFQRLVENHDTTIWPERMPPPYDELRRQAATADGLLTMLTERVDAELIEASPNLKVISNYAVGFDNVDVAAAAARGIPIGHTPDVLTDATADLTWALLLTAARRIPEAQTWARSGEWETWGPDDFLGADVHGATLGVIGFGRIGRAVARRAEGFGMAVLSVGRPDHRDAAAELDNLLEQSDFVTLHSPLTAQTRHLIDAAALTKMKSTAILINTARGPIVDQLALADALATGQIAGAALDVTDPEPLPSDNALWHAPNLVIVPHIGSATVTARAKMTEIAVENLLAGLAGEPLPHQVPVPSPAQAD